MAQLLQVQRTRLLRLSLAAIFIAIVAVILLAPQKGHNEKLAENEVSILFGGDVMLGRGVEYQANKFGDNYLFEKLEPLFQGSDYAVINLEGPIVVSHSPTPGGSFTFSFDSRFAKILKNIGVDFASLGNNHAFDQGREGLTQTRELLGQSGIAYAGDSRNEEPKYSTTIKNRVVNFTSLNATWPSIWDEEKLLEDMSNGATANALDVLIIHWGDEYQPTSNNFQKDFAHKAIESGIDLIIGHHPHVVQEVEKYNGKIIFYSLGNLIFDQYFSKETEEGLLVRLYSSDDGENYELIPTVSQKSQPRQMAEPERGEFLNQLAAKSSPELKTEIVTGRINN